MRVFPCIGHDHSSLQGQDAHPLFCLEPIIMPKLIGQGGRNILWGRVKSLVTLRGQPCFASSVILLHLCPERLVGRPDLAGDRACHMSGYLEAGADLIVGPPLQAYLVAHLAMFKSIATHIVQGVTIGQLGSSQGLKLVRRCVQFEFGGECCFHHFSIVKYLLKVFKRQWYHSAPAPNKECGGFR